MRLIRWFFLTEHYSELFNKRSKNHSISGTPRTFAFSNRAVYVQCCGINIWKQIVCVNVKKANKTVRNVVLGVDILYMVEYLKKFVYNGLFDQRLKQTLTNKIINVWKSQVHKTNIEVNYICTVLQSIKW